MVVQREQHSIRTVLKVRNFPVPHGPGQKIATRLCPPCRVPGSKVGDLKVLPGARVQLVVSRFDAYRARPSKVADSPAAHADRDLAGRLADQSIVAERIRYSTLLPAVR